MILPLHRWRLIILQVLAILIKVMRQVHLQWQNKIPLKINHFTSVRHFDQSHAASASSMTVSLYRWRMGCRHNMCDIYIANNDRPLADELTDEDIMYNLWLVWSLVFFSLLICLSFINKSVISQTYVFRVITSNCELLNLSHTTSLKACKNISEKNRSLKETVSRDFRPLVFFINQLHLGPWLTP
jgi:hypothetical protein